MNIIEAREQELRTEQANRERAAREREQVLIKIADNAGSYMHWDGQESWGKATAAQEERAGAWVQQAVKAQTRAEVGSSVSAAVAAAQKAAELSKNAAARKAESQARVDASMALVRASRLRVMEAETALGAGTTDASEATRNYLEYIVAVAERSYLQNAHDDLLKEVSNGAGRLVSEFTANVEYAAAVASAIQDLNSSWGLAGPSKERAAKIGETVKSVVELGYCAVELGKLAAANQFLELHPRKDFEALSRIFEDSALVKLGLREPEPTKETKGIGRTIKAALGVK